MTQQSHPTHNHHGSSPVIVLTLCSFFVCVSLVTSLQGNEAETPLTVEQIEVGIKQSIEKIAEARKLISENEALNNALNAKRAQAASSPSTTRYLMDGKEKSRDEFIALIDKAINDNNNLLERQRKQKNTLETGLPHLQGVLKQMKNGAVEEGAKNIKKKERDSQSLSGNYSVPSTIEVDKVTKTARVPIILNYRKGHQDAYAQDYISISSVDPKKPVSGNGGLTVGKADKLEGSKTAYLNMSASQTTKATISIRTQDGTASYGKMEFEVQVVVP